MKYFVIGNVVSLFLYFFLGNDKEVMVMGDYDGTRVLNAPEKEIIGGDCTAPRKQAG